MSSPKVGFVSLGCPKALVDSERILTQLRTEGYQIVPDYDNADVVVVNTCGFIDSAKAESLDAIGEAIAENGRVIVTGCMGVEESVIRAAHPSVLAVTGPQQYEQVVRAVHEAAPPSSTHDPFTDLVPPQGIKLTPRHYAYLKISEGCNHRCSFCIIPSMRGDLVSRPVGDVLDEAQRLAQAGVKELLVISQDTSAYGVDIKFRTGFWNGRPVRTHMTDLVTALGELAKQYGAWVRLHYVYPYPHVDEVIPLMNGGHVLPYLDVPLQHAHPDVLKRMKRPANGEKNIERIRAWRAACPDIVIRSTFIAGFPGETEEEFQYLLDFLEEAQIDRLGCFAYSPVDGAAANELAGAVPDEVREERRARVMQLQEKISRQRLQAKVGKTLRVLIDKVDNTGATARSAADAPEIDGVVYVKRPYDPGFELKVGEFIDVRITAADAHDMWGSVD